MSCFKSNKTLYDCVSGVLLNVYIYPVFVGNGWLELVSSHLPNLRELHLIVCPIVQNEYVKVLVAALPKLKVFK